MIVCMLHATKLEDVLTRVGKLSTPDALAERLVSLLFAPPGAPIWNELRNSVAYLDQQTGCGIPDEHVGPDPQSFDWTKRAFFFPAAFNKIEHEVHIGHRDALRAKGINTEAWRYSGGTELVNLMAYKGEPDWLTLRAIRIDGKGLDLNLSELAARMRDWEAGPIDPDLSPGLGPALSSPWVRDLVAGLLTTSANWVAAGVVGGGAYDMVKIILGS
jgi:hypothetical protein